MPRVSKKWGGGTVPPLQKVGVRVPRTPTFYACAWTVSGSQCYVLFFALAYGVSMHDSCSLIVVARLISQREFSQ